MRSLTAVTDPRAIVSLAVLKVNWDEQGKDYLDNLIPFLRESLRSCPQDEVALEYVSNKINELVSFAIPRGVVRTLLRRAKKLGYVRHVSGHYHIVRDALPPVPLARRENDLRRDCEALVDKFRAFASEHYQKQWTGLQAEEALLKMLAASASQLLRSLRLGEKPNQRALTEGDSYVAAKFVEHVYDKDNTAYKQLETVATGAVLADALYYEDQTLVAEGIDDLDAYLDTPLLLEAIGLNGEHFRAPLLELLDLMKAQGIRCYVFRQTFDEMQGVLDAHANCTGAQRYHIDVGPYRKHLAPSDARLLADQLEERLGELGVRVVDRPPFEHTYDLDEAALEDHLHSVVNYRSKTALRHDAQALVAAHQLRRGRRPSRLEHAKAVFVTTNRKLAYATQQFFLSQQSSTRRRAPLCIMADAFGTRLWLKSPNDAPKLPARQLLARAYAAMQPSDALIEKYLEEAERLKKSGVITKKDYLQLRSSYDLLGKIIDATLNEASAFTEGTLDEVRERSVQAIRKASAERVERSEKARREAEREKEHLQSDLEKERAASEQNKMLAQEQQEALGKEREEKRLANRRIEEMLADDEARLATIDSFARVVRRSVYFLTLLPLSAALILGVVWMDFLPIIGAWTTWPERLIAMAVLLIVLFAIAEQVSAAKRIAKRPAERAEKAVKGWLVRLFKLDATVAMQEA